MTAATRHRQAKPTWSGGGALVFNTSSLPALKHATWPPSGGDDILSGGAGNDLLCGGLGATTPSTAAPARRPISASGPITRSPPKPTAVYSSPAPVPRTA